MLASYKVKYLHSNLQLYVHAPQGFKLKERREKKKVVAGTYMTQGAFARERSSPKEGKEYRSTLELLFDAERTGKIGKYMLQR